MHFHPSSYNLEQIKSHSEGEYRTFKEFIRIDDKRTDKWDVYYSYYYRKREKVDGIKIFDNNEIDFLILAPNIGIFVLEVKGGYIKNNHGRLFSIDRFGKSHFIDPYNQAKNNYYGITNIILELSNRKIDLRKYISGPLVALPDTSKFIDVPQSNGYDTYLKNKDMLEFIKNASKNLLKGNNALIPPTAEDIEKIKEVLNGPEFEYKLSKKDYINSINIAINDLTEEQFAIFRGLLKNKRCLINGRAGTGKTVISEFLFKEFMINQKQRVLYLSYNSLISLRVKADLRDDVIINAFPINAFLEDAVTKVDPLFDFNTLPQNEKMDTLVKMVTKIFKENKIKKFDCLILDEAQDISLNDDIIALFDSIIKGGIKDGRIYLFYDENQTVYKENKKIYQSELFLDDWYRYSFFDLIRNCRNGAGIKNAIDEIFINKTIDKDIENEDVKYYQIDNDEKYAPKIINEIEKLIKDGISYSQITILVDQKKNNFILDALLKHYNNGLTEYKATGNKKLTYSTAYAFKGLENDVIFYISVNKRTKFDVHYVAISRAKALVYIYKK